MLEIMLALKSETCWSASISNIDLNVAFTMFVCALSSVQVIACVALVGETTTISCLLLLTNCRNFLVLLSCLGLPYF